MSDLDEALRILAMFVRTCEMLNKKSPAMAMALSDARRLLKASGKMAETDTDRLDRELAEARAAIPKPSNYGKGPTRY